MAGKPYDATMKDLIEADAVAYSALATASSVRRATLVDADVATVSAAADKVLRVEDDAGEWLLDLEPEARHAADAPERLHLYATLLRQRHGLRVRSVLLLLRPEANASNLTGVLTDRHPDELEPYLVFRYKVIRVWQEPLVRFLQGGLGLLPLAALTDEASGNLASVVRQIESRAQREAIPALAAKLGAATFLLLGLRYPADTMVQLFEGVKMIEESSTYQWLLERGRAEGRAEGKIQEARDLLLWQGSRKFGRPADAAEVARLESVQNLEQLKDLACRLLIVSTWQDLLVGI